MTEENPAARLFSEIAANTERLVKATQLFGQTKDEDVAIGTTPKHVVMRRDKVELFRYEPTAEATATTPVLLAYGLIGRYTMADLQPDRSLVRSLLSKGLDLWLIDWGQPGRTERWLTIDDYVDDYIDAAVDRICQETGHDQVTLLGICEGGVFTTCYAALHPEKVKNLVLTITPIDFHADVKDTAAHHGFLNIWTRSLDPEDIDKLVDTYGGVLPGEFMSSVFSMMTPMRTLTKYNVDHRCCRRRSEIHELPADGKMVGRPAAPSGRGREAVAQRAVPGKPPCRWQLHSVGSSGQFKVHHCAGTKRICAGRSHYSTGHVACAWREDRQQRLYGDSPSGRTCRALCLEQVAGQAQQEHR